MNGFGGRIKKVRGRVTSSLLALTVAGSILAAPGIAAAKGGPTTTTKTTHQPTSDGTGHKIK